MLTSAVDLDPYRYKPVAYRFFPKGTPYNNPLPTILLDISGEDSKALPFLASSGLPARVIPPPEPTFSEYEAQHYSRNGVLKQDFKWLPDDEGDRLRRGFLEQFAMVAAYELRRRYHPQIPRRVALTGSYPLAYLPAQHSRLVEAFEDVRHVFEQGGFPRVDLEPLISESYANFLFIDERYTDQNRTKTGRLVVIDIGGGTTDISVSTETGEVCYLDSLMIGGKDLSQKLLPYQILKQDRSDQVLNALNLSVRPESRSDKNWCDAVQYILIKKMREDQGLRDLRSQFQKSSMTDLLGALLGLLTYATAYGAKLALQPNPSDVERLTFKFGGLGSRLFEMSPVFPPYAKPWDAARAVLTGVVKSLPGLDHLKSIKIDRLDEGKQAVCLGAALATANDDRAREARTALRTIWWSDFPSVGDTGPIAWNSEFDARMAKGLSEGQIDGACVSPLLELVDATIEKVGSATFGEGWRPSEPAFSEAREMLATNYRNGCSRFIGNTSGKPPHLPVKQFTEGLKEVLCGTIHE